VLLATTSVVAGDSDEFVVRPRSLELAVREVGNGWREWQGFPLDTNERVSALYVTPADADPTVRGVWMGTSDGWLYRGTGENWTIIGAENAGNLQFDWAARSFEHLTDFRAPFLEIEVSQDGVWATTSKAVYQHMPHAE
jgi:hypothetical protein